MRYKRQLIALGIVTLLLMALFWVSTRSVLIISQPSDAPDATYELWNRDGSTTNPVKMNGDVRKTVPASTYLVVVRSNERSYVSFATTKGFLRITTVTPRLQTEAKRTFLGDNPAPCMYALGNRFYSTECQGSTTDLYEHIAATPNLPSYTKRAPTSGLPGLLVGIITTKSGETIALTFDGDTQLYTISKIDENLNPTEKRNYTPVNSGGSYTVKPYLDGFVVFSQTTRTLDYFSSFAATPKSLTIDKANDDSRDTLYTVSVQPSQITATYVSSKNTNALNPTDFDDDSVDGEFPDSDARTEIVFVGLDRQDHVTLDKTPKYITACGTDFVCTFERHTLTVYERKGTKLKQRFLIRNVDAIAGTAEAFRAITKYGVLAFDATLTTGHLEYSLGSYKFSDAQFDMSSYVISVIDTMNTKSALRIDTTTANDDSIDKKVTKLFDTQLVKQISVNRNIIYIVPEYGTTSYDEQSGLNLYEPSQVRQVNKAIDTLIAASGIDRQRYTFASTGYNP